MEVSFEDFLNEAKAKFTKNGWTTLYRNAEDTRPGNHSTVYGGLVSEEALSKELEGYSWNALLGHGRPGEIFFWEDGEQKWRYDRFSENRIEPFIIYRDFPGIDEAIIELSEEFRLYFNLFEKKTNSQTSFYWIDDNAEYHEIARITKEEVSVRTKFLRIYLSVRKIYLILQFECMRFSEKSLSELDIRARDETVQENEMVYNVFTRDISSMGIRGDRTQNWLLGKVVLRGFDDYTPDLFETYAENGYESFLIGYDDDGEEKYFTCEEKCLSNYFTQIDDAPHFLTPVYFDRDVLKKYYDSPHKYSVEDGGVWLKNFWRLRLDNNCGEYVVVFLGDLGRIPYKEQKYWKSYNIAPQGGMSSTNIKRAFDGAFADPVGEEHFFKQKYSHFQEVWNEKFGWHIFLPLTAGDKHYLEYLHIPSKDNLKEFEEQVLALTKILIDSINQKIIERELTQKDARMLDQAKGGIDKFDLYLKETTNKNFEGMILYLRRLQLLRSTNVAHRKSSRGNNKAVAYFKLEAKNYHDAFSDILLKAIWVLNTLENEFLD